MPVDESVYAAIECISQSPLHIQSMTVQAHADCTLFMSVALFVMFMLLFYVDSRDNSSQGCSGDSLIFAGSNPSIPSPFAGNVSSYNCKFLA
jgi:hypothetical protein